MPEGYSTANYVADQGSRTVITGTIDASNATGFVLPDDFLLADHIPDDLITNAMMADNAIDTAEIVDLAVTDAKINDVDGSKIASLSIGSAALATDSVKTAKIEALAVTDAKINDVDGSKIAAASVDTAQLTDAAVNASKIDSKTVTYANMNMFISTEQTGTGSPQNIAHGLSSTPSQVLVVPTDLNPATTGDWTVTEGAHDGTNVVVTVTSNKLFKVMAIV